MDNEIMIAYYLGTSKENNRTSLFDQLVCLATKSRYSHIEYVKEYSPVTGIAKCWSSSPRDNGVRCKEFYLDPKAWELYSVKTDVTTMSILSWFYGNEGRKYDWLGAFATVLPFIKQSSTRVFCSEAIACAMSMANPSKNTPQSIFTCLAPDSTKLSF